MSFVPGSSLLPMWRCCVLLPAFGVRLLYQQPWLQAASPLQQSVDNRRLGKSGKGLIGAVLRRGQHYSANRPGAVVILVRCSCLDCGPMGTSSLKAAV